MHILVTGAGGFIGRAVVRKARLRGWNVTGIARRSSPEANLLADLRNPIHLQDTPDAVIHLAGVYAGCRMKSFVENDLVIAKNLIEWGKQQNVRRWIVASAAEVYGDIIGEADEQYPCRPVIPYGEIKLQIEAMFRSAGFPEVTACRVGEVYGSEGHILQEISSKLRSGFFPWGGSGNVKISFVHVEDVAEALLLSCERAMPGFHVFNISDNEPATWKQFLETIAAGLHTRKPVYFPKPAAYCYSWIPSWIDRILARPANVTPQVLRLLTTPKILLSNRAHEQLGFIPKYPDIEAGLKEVLRSL